MLKVGKTYTLKVDTCDLGKATVAVDAPEIGVWFIDSTLLYREDMSVGTATKYRDGWYTTEFTFTTDKDRTLELQFTGVDNLSIYEDGVLIHYLLHSRRIWRTSE